jgi:hypothetical protein
MGAANALAAAGAPSPLGENLQNVRSNFGQVDDVLDELLDVENGAAAVWAPIEARLDFGVDMVRPLAPSGVVPRGPPRRLPVTVALALRASKTRSLPVALPLSLQQFLDDTLEVPNLSTRLLKLPLQLLDADISGVALVGHGRA